MLVLHVTVVVLSLLQGEPGHIAGLVVPFDNPRRIEAVGGSVGVVDIGIPVLLCEYPDSGIPARKGGLHALLLPVRVVARARSIDRKSVLHQERVDQTTCPACAASVAHQLHLDVVRHTLCLVVFPPHQHFRVVLKAVVAEHHVVRIQRLERHVHPLFGVGVLRQFPDNLFPDSLGRGHRLCQEITDFGVDIQTAGILGLARPALTARDECGAFVVLEPGSFVKSHPRAEQMGHGFADPCLTRRRSLQEHLCCLVQVGQDETRHLVSRLPFGRLHQNFLLIRKGGLDNRTVAYVLKHVEIGVGADQVDFPDVMPDVGGGTLDLSRLVFRQHLLQKIVAVPYLREVPHSRGGRHPPLSGNPERGVINGGLVIRPVVAAEGAYSIGTRPDGSECVQVD